MRTDEESHHDSAAGVDPSGISFCETLPAIAMIILGSLSAEHGKTAVHLNLPLTSQHQHLLMSLPSHREDITCAFYSSPSDDSNSQPHRDEKA